MNQPYFLSPEAQLVQRRDQSSFPLDQGRVDEKLTREMAPTIFQAAQETYIAQNQQIVHYRALERVRATPVPVESMLMVGVIAAATFYFQPETLLLAIGVGNLLSAWGPLPDLLLENGGEFITALIQRFTQEECSDKILGYLIMSGPLSYALSWVPFVGGTLNWFVQKPYAFGVGLLLGNYLWNQQISAWRAHHPDQAEASNPNPQQGAIATIFQIRRLIDRIDNALAARIPQFQSGTRMNQLAQEIRGWDTWITGGKLAVACGTVGLLSILYSCPHTFTSSIILTTYFCATSELVDGAFTDNAIMRRFPHISTGIIAFGAAIAALIGTVFSWGVANGLATAAYWRGPFNFPAYQVLGWAYVNSLWNYAFTAGTGALIGHQLWCEARALYLNRPPEPKPDLISAIAHATGWLFEKSAGIIKTLFDLSTAGPDERRLMIESLFSPDNRPPPRNQEQH